GSCRAGEPAWHAGPAEDRAGNRLPAHRNRKDGRRQGDAGVAVAAASRRGSSSRAAGGISAAAPTASPDGSNSSGPSSGPSSNPSFAGRGGAVMISLLASVRNLVEAQEAAAAGADLI